MPLHQLMQRPWKRLKTVDNVDDSSSEFGDPQIRQNQNFDGQRRSRLCSLPDEILHSILGLLPTEEAIRTCILSKRWERLWMSMPVLIFLGNHPRGGRPHFINFVNRACALHKPYPVQTFVLSCNELRNAPLMDAWITYAIIKGRVQVLHLLLDDNYVLPHCTFSSETLVEFRLNFQDRTLQLPSMISLPRLKKLHLVRVGLVNGETIQKLLTSAPLLETLSLTNCVWENNNVFKRISASRLRLLNIQAGNMWSLPPVRIECANLENFCFVGKLEKEVFLCGSPKLDVTRICLKGAPTADNVLKLLHSVATVKRLAFLVGFIQGFNSSLYLSRFPLFKNLIELELSVAHCHGRMGLTMTMLRICPCLESIAFHLDGRTVELQDPVPPCFQTHLKKITLIPFRGGATEISSIGMLLQQGAVLEEMVLNTTMRGKPDADQVLEKVRTLPKASKACTIYYGTWKCII